MDFDGCVSQITSLNIDVCRYANRRSFDDSHRIAPVAPNAVDLFHNVVQSVFIHYFKLLASEGIRVRSR